MDFDDSCGTGSEGFGTSSNLSNEGEGKVMETSNVSNTNGLLTIGVEPFGRPDIDSTSGVFNVRGYVDIVVVKGTIEKSKTVVEAANTISCSLWVSCST